MTRFFWKWLNKARESNIHITFGSTQDDEFYIEYRRDKDQCFSFITMSTEGNDIIVYLGEGSNVPSISINHLKLIIQEIERETQKKEHLDQYNLIVSSNNYRTIIKVGIENNNVAMRWEDFKSLIFQGEKKLIEERKQWKEVL
ncbi:MAG: hypothetical protein AAFO82_20630, partial [Bacteroidota bacterium]